MARHNLHRQTKQVLSLGLLESNPSYSWPGRQGLIAKEKNDGQVCWYTQHDEWQDITFWFRNRTCCIPSWMWPGLLSSAPSLKTRMIAKEPFHSVVLSYLRWAKGIVTGEAYFKVKDSALIRWAIRTHHGGHPGVEGIVVRWSARQMSWTHKKTKTWFRHNVFVVSKDFPYWKIDAGIDSNQCTGTNQKAVLRIDRTSPFESTAIAETIQIRLGTGCSVWDKTNATLYWRERLVHEKQENGAKVRGMAFRYACIFDTIPFWKQVKSCNKCAVVSDFVS